MSNLLIVSLLTCVCGLQAVGQVRAAKPQPTPTAAASPQPRRETIYYTITLTDGTINAYVPNASNFLADPVETLQHNGFAVPAASERHWRSLTVALRRLSNPKLPAARIPTVNPAILKNEVVRLQMPKGWIPVVGNSNGDGTISIRDFLSDPVGSLRAQGMNVPGDDEALWRQLADALKGLRREYARTQTQTGIRELEVLRDVDVVGNASKDGTREIATKREKESQSRSDNQVVTGRITGVAVDPNQTNKKITNIGQPDLMIKQFLFPPTNDKAVRVQVLNQGNATSVECRLILTIRKINGTAAGRQTHVPIPTLAPGKTVWLVVDTKGILPLNISLAATTFKLNADATGIVAESDENNNEVNHNH
ncbi:MAG TPA: CARDB domain-containing protein [Pyrinomonadaceae bacterium]|nr:CARDB domain-containing protein [Pyrinomonadaceae bacterium]